MGEKANKLDERLSRPPPVDFRELVLKYFPDADDQFIEVLLWERTPYPLGTAGKTPCEECNRPVVKGKTECKKCIEWYGDNGK